MKSNRGVSIIEIIISISLLSLIMLFLFRLLIVVRNEDNTNIYKANVNAISSSVLSSIYDDINSKGIQYLFKPKCIALTPDPNNCCCSQGSYDCLKMFYKNNEVKELAVFQTNSFNDSIKYGEVKRTLPKGYSFLDYQVYTMANTNKFESNAIDKPDPGQYISVPEGSNYKVDSIMVLNIPIYRISKLNNSINIYAGYDFSAIESALGPTNTDIMLDYCPIP